MVSIVLSAHYVNIYNLTPLIRWGRMLTGIVIIMLIAGCAQPKPVAQRTEVFTDADLAPFMREGTGTVTGDAFLTTRGGSVQRGSGRTVQLIPATPYTTEAMQRQIIPRVRMDPPIDQRLDHYTRLTTANSLGESDSSACRQGPIMYCVSSRGKSSKSDVMGFRLKKPVPWPTEA